MISPHWSFFTEYCTEGGLAYFTGKVSSPRMEFHALRVDLSCTELRIVVSDGNPSAKVSSFVRDINLLAGINALPFSPVSAREGEPRTNIGAVIADGIMLSQPHPWFDALVFYTDGSAAIIPQAAIQSAENIEHAVGGFLRILEFGEPVLRVLSLNERHPRSAAGLSPDGRFLYLLVIDGRRSGSIGGTEEETALVLRALGASEGINFDGGGSSALALRFPDGAVRVVNNPVHGRLPASGRRTDRERAVAGCLGIGLVCIPWLD
ncbi:MAG: phosphodiester glycosidase family protein [Treponema sp.]|nr:phosphodiester glycosidase family protein [Treponema sp.]